LLICLLEYLIMFKLFCNIKIKKYRFKVLEMDIFIKLITFMEPTPTLIFRYLA